MRPIRIPSAINALLLAAAVALPASAPGAEMPDVQEVLQAIRSHAGGISEADLNRAAVIGLVSELGPRIQLIPNGTNEAAKELSVTRTDVFDSQIGYIRIAQVGNDFPAALRQACRELGSSNKLTGLVLDLRFAEGTDYEAAGAGADLFISAERPLLKWENGVVGAKAKSNAIQLPLAILVNQGTTGAAEALAAALRFAGAGLILGNRTAGEAFVVRDYPLKDGSILRIGTHPVSLANGTPVSTNGVKPDIDVTVSPEDERVYYADAFSLVRTNGAAPGSTNQLAGGGRTRFGEAELVRRHRAGLRRTRDLSEDELPAGVLESRPQDIRDAEPERPLVSDPALARALDLLKGLAVVRQSRF